MELRARAAGTHLPHLPEVLLVPQLENPLRREVGVLEPQLARLVVRHVHGGPQAVRVEPELRGDELPRVADRLALEVVAEGEVAEHLEEGVVARRAPHLLEVVVLAAHPQALLGRHHPRSRRRHLALEGALELNHAGVGEQEGRVVRGHQRAGRQVQVRLPPEVLDEPLTNVGRIHSPLVGLRGRFGSRAPSGIPRTPPPSPYTAAPARVLPGAGSVRAPPSGR